MEEYYALKSFSTNHEKEDKIRLVINGDCIYGEINHKDEFTLDLYSSRSRKYIGYIETSDTDKLIKKIIRL